MLSDFGVGIRLALSEYPGVKWLKSAKSRRSLHRKWARSNRLWWLINARMDGHPVTIDDADKLAGHMHRQLVIDCYDTLHRQNRYTYERWKREIGPRVGKQNILSICGINGTLRGADMHDLKLKWCPRCWPTIQQTIDKYLLWKGSSNI